MVGDRLRRSRDRPCHRDADRRHHHARLPDRGFGTVRPGSACADGIGGPQSTFSHRGAGRRCHGARLDRCDRVVAMVADRKPIGTVRHRLRILRQDSDAI
jgi:hypothetical protein